MLWAANELDSREEADTAGKKHGESPQTKSTLLARVSSGRVPAGELPATALVVDVVEEAALGDEQSIRLEWTFKTTEGLDPASDLAFSGVVGTDLAPVADLHVVRGLHDVGNVPRWVNLLAIIQYFHFIFEAVMWFGSKIRGPFSSRRQVLRVIVGSSLTQHSYLGIGASR